MRSETRVLQRNHLDRQLESARIQDLAKSPQGWIKAVREALGMSGRQLADRLAIVPSHRMQLEKGEVAGTATVRSLERAAAAMGCEFVYAFVPKNNATFEQLVRQQAHEVAKRIVDEVDTTMALEAQSADSQFRKREIDRIAAELISSMPRNLWDQ